MSNKIVTLDVREELRQGREPFSLIIRTVSALKPGQSLMLIAPFEPIPLYGVLANRGFTHVATATPEGDWKILFEPATVADVKPAEVVRPPCPAQDPPALVVDARGLEPPQPMVKILEAVATLPAGDALDAHTDRRPMHLLPQLEERGYHGECSKQSDGSYITHIRPCAR